jgi:hypothetical protein
VAKGILDYYNQWRHIDKFDTSFLPGLVGDSAHIHWIEYELGKPNLAILRNASIIFLASFDPFPTLQREYAGRSCIVRLDNAIPLGSATFIV